MNTLLVARRDLGAYLHGFSGYAIIAMLLFVDGLWFNVVAMGDAAKYSHEVLEHFFEGTFGTTVVAALLLSMRSFAEEQSTGTEVIYRTSPVSVTEVVLGKYLAAMTMLLIFIGLTIYMPGLIFVNGRIAPAHVAVGYLGVVAVASAVTSIGVFGSSLFKNQFASVFLSATVTVTLLICWALSDLTDPPFTEAVAWMALYQGHYQAFMEGRLLTSGLVFYGSLTFVFLMLTTKVLEGRRWQ